jgi:hypothetical protein
VQPLFEFHNFGTALPGHWTTITNNADFGVDYFTRTAAANRMSSSTERLKRAISMATSTRMERV